MHVTVIGGLIGQLPKLNETVRNIDTGDRHSINTCTQRFTRALCDVADPLFSKTTLRGDFTKDCFFPIGPIWGPFHKHTYVQYYRNSSLKLA